MRSITKNKLSVAITVALAMSGGYSPLTLADQQETMTVYGSENLDRSQQFSGLKMDASWLEVPQTVSVVTAEDIEARGAVRLGEALRGVPGVAQTLGEGSRDQVTIRGFEAMYDIYRDGLRDAGGNQMYRSLANIERVEVIKGAAGALYGRGSAGGLINLVTKRADGNNVRELSVNAGSWNSYGMTADLGGELTDGINGRINIELKDHESFVDNVEGQTLFIAPTLRAELSDTTTLDLDLEYFNQEQDPYRGVPSVNGVPVNVDRSTNYASVTDFQENETIRLAATLTHQLNNEMKLTTKAFYSHIDIEQSGTRISSVNTGAGTIDQKVRKFAYDPQEDLGLQAELNWELDRHNLLLGAEVAQMKRTFKMGDSATFTNSIYNPTTITVAVPDFNDASTSHNKVESRSLYAQDVFALTDTIDLIGGLRYDNIDVTRTGSGPSEFSQSEFSPRAGIVWQATDNSSVYATWGRSYQVPWAGIYTRDTNAALQESNLAEIGFKAELLDKKLQFGTSVFQIDKDIPSTNADGEITAINEHRHKGIEFELNGEITQQWSVAAGLTYLDAENLDTGLRPNDVPEKSASVWNSFKPTDNWTMGLGLVYVGERFVGNEGARLDSYTTVDAMVAYETGPHKIQLNLNNITDEEYFIGATGGGTGDENIGYGAPFNAMLSYKLSF